jgi:hypothetical protein
MQTTSIARRRATLLALSLVVALVAVGNAAAYRPLLEEGPAAGPPSATVSSGRPIPAEVHVEDSGRDLVPLAVGIGAALLTVGTLALVTRRRREPAAG